MFFCLDLAILILKPYQTKVATLRMPEENEEREKMKNEMMEKDLKSYEYVENLKNYFAIFKKENNLVQMEKLLKGKHKRTIFLICVKMV